MAATPLFHQSLGELLTMLQAAKVLEDETKKRLLQARSKHLMDEAELWEKRADQSVECQEMILDQIGTDVFDACGIPR